MEYRPLGRSGVMVSSLCLGVMNFGGVTNEADSIAMIDRALELDPACQPALQGSSPRARRGHECGDPPQPAVRAGTDDLSPRPPAGHNRAGQDVLVAAPVDRDRLACHRRLVHLQS